MYIYIYIPYSGKGLEEKRFGEFTLFEYLAKKFDELINQPKGY